MLRQRLAIKRLRALADNFPAVCVVGARQVGKSTLLCRLFAPEGDAVVFDPTVDVENARRDPDLFFDNHVKRPLILDEIQYAPEVVAALKRRIDRDRKPGQFLLTGSQQWGVMRSLAESLAGRVVFLDLEGFSLAEISDALPGANWLEAWLNNPASFAKERPARFENRLPMTELLWRGFLPEAQSQPLTSVADFHLGYFRTYIERDARNFTDLADLTLFSRFVQLAAALTAQEINRSHIGREIGVTPQTARRWLDLLRATFQWFEVPAFSGNSIKRVSGKPKGYFADSGLACSAQRISSPSALAGHPLMGALFETAVLAELRKLAALLAPPPAFFHWRAAGGAEVDVLLERDGQLYPIEIKLTSRPSRDDTRGITALRKSYSKLRIGPGLVIAPTERFIKISDEDFAIPWDSRLST
jgi:predicted AAA+ superfamily ATPase